MLLAAGRPSLCALQDNAANRSPQHTRCCKCFSVVEQRGLLCERP